MEVFRIQHIELSVLNAERIRVLALIGECMASEWVHEVGSTAIPGVIGKQDLDFLVLVPPSELQTARARLDMRFLRNPEQLSNEVYQGYTVASKLDVSIQLTIKGGAHDTFLVFLCHLRERADLRAESAISSVASGTQAEDLYQTRPWNRPVKMTILSVWQLSERWFFRRMFGYTESGRGTPTRQAFLDTTGRLCR